MLNLCKFTKCKSKIKNLQKSIDKSRQSEYNVNIAKRL